MINLLNRIFPEKKEIAPTSVTSAFKKDFNKPKNTEWIKLEDGYEAVFYLRDIEHIARYSQSGTLLSHKINLPLNSVPDFVLRIAAEQGELMNVIEIRRSNFVNYELIVRDKALTRYFVLLDSYGNTIEKKTL